MGCCNNKQENRRRLDSSRSLGSLTSLQDVSTFLRCPYCLQDFYDDLSTTRFAEHLLVCKRHSNFNVNEDWNSELSKESPYADKVT